VYIRYYLGVFRPNSKIDSISQILGLCSTL
jgi:hypothetical protein